MASPFSLKYKYILNSGLAKVANLIANISSLPITKFELGSSVNYNPDLSQTSCLTPVFDDTNPLASGNYEISVIKIDNTKVQIDFLINNLVGDFDIGEIILKFSDGTPFIIGVLETTFQKFKDPGGNAFQVSIVVNILNSDVIVPTTTITVFNSINTVNTEGDLPDINDASTNVYLIRNYNNTGSYAFAFKDTTASEWRFNSQIQGDQNEDEILLVNNNRNPKSSGRKISTTNNYVLAAELLSIPTKQSVKDYSEGNYIKKIGDTTSGFITKTGSLDPTDPAILSPKDYVDYRTDSIKNKVINGTYQFWQRGLSFTNPSSNSYIADRWLVEYNGTPGSFSYSRQSFSAGELEGHGLYSKYFLRYNCTSAYSGQTINKLKQRIENVRSLAGRNITFSFYAKASSNVVISTGASQYLGPSGSGSPTTISDQNHSLTTNWARYSHSFQFSSLNGMTIDDVVSPGSNSYSEIKFNLPNNAAITIDFAYVQVEVGTSKSYFDFRDAYVEMKMCQRYFEKSYNLDVSPGTVTAIGNLQTVAVAVAISGVVFTRSFLVRKRSIPTITIYNPGTGAVGSIRNTNNSNNIAASANDIGESTLNISNTSATGVQANQIHTVHFTADSEL